MLGAGGAILDGGSEFSGDFEQKPEGREEEERLEKGKYSTS